MAPVDVPEPSVPSSARGRRTNLLVAGVVGVVVMVLVAGVAWWLRHDTALLRDDGSRGSMTGHVGSTSFVPMALVEDTSTSRVVDLRSVEPVVVQNTADATFAVMVCTVDPVPAHWKVPDATSNIPFGCLSIAPFTPGKLDLNPNAHRLMVAVTANKPGTFTMDGAVVDYRDGIRSGHQHASAQVRITASAQYA